MRAAYLLGTVGTKHEDGLVPIGQCDTIHEGPDVTKTAGGELHTGREAELGVARELRVRLTVVKEVLPGKVAFKSGDEVLGRDTVTCVRANELRSGS